MTFKVTWCDQEKECDDLTEAMLLSKQLKDCHGITARIFANGMEIVGSMGGDMVEDGLLPNGEPYTWYKRRSVKDTKFKGRKR